MSNKKVTHTPGPWRIGDAGHTVFGPKTNRPVPKVIAINASREDARLIAVAPELLELVKTVPISEPTKEFDEWLMEAQKAIAKAEGK